MGSEFSTYSDSNSDDLSPAGPWSGNDIEPPYSWNESSNDSEDDGGSTFVLGDLISMGRTTPVIDYMEKHNMTQEYYHQCLEKGKDNPPHILGPYMPLPVGQAAYYGQKDIMNAIIARGFDSNAQDYATTDDDLSRPIHYAALQGHLDVVKCLVEDQGVDVDSKNGRCDTALTHAIRNGNLVMVKYLVEAGAALNSNSETEPPLNVAALSDESHITEYLISMGADVNIKNEWYSSPLCQAEEYLVVDNARALISAGANIHETDQCGRTPFLMAAASQNVDLMRFLLSQGADPNVVDDFGNTALHTMIHSGSYRLKYEEVAYLVVELGMNCLNTRNSWGFTPLSLAMSSISKVRIIELLANYGSNIEEEMFQSEDDNNKLPILQKPGGRKVLDHLKGLSSKPRTLQDIVCIKIRRVVGAQLESAVNDLPLPEIIRNLVKIKWISDPE